MMTKLPGDVTLGSSWRIVVIGQVHRPVWKLIDGEWRSLVGSVMMNSKMMGKLQRVMIIVSPALKTSLRISIKTYGWEIQVCPPT